MLSCLAFLPESGFKKHGSQPWQANKLSMREHFLVGAPSVRDKRRVRSHRQRFLKHQTDLAKRAIITQRALLVQVPLETLCPKRQVIGYPSSLRVVCSTFFRMQTIAATDYGDHCCMHDVSVVTSAASEERSRRKIDSSKEKGIDRDTIALLRCSGSFLLFFVLFTEISKLSLYAT